MSPRSTARHRTEPMGAAQVSPALSDADRVRLLGALTPSEVYLAADLATSATRAAVSADADPPARVETAGRLRTAAGWLALFAWAWLCAYIITSGVDYDREHPTTSEAP